MSSIEEILEFNKQFVEDKQYKEYAATKRPQKKIAVLSCMDARLTETLPAALNFKNGDIEMIKIAGAVISHPFGSVMRSILISVYELGVEEILVIGHYDCGMHGMDAGKLVNRMVARGISTEKLDFINYCGVDISKWFKGFDNVAEAVLKTVDVIKSHPLIPADISVYGFIINPTTGKLDKVGSAG
jgi:carbonic anhydrase